MCEPCTNYGDVTTETQLSFSWGQRKGAILEDFTDMMASDMGLEG